MRGEVGVSYARPDVPVAAFVTEDFGSVQLPVSAAPVALRQMAVCDAAEVVVVQALGLGLTCDAAGRGVTFVSFSRSSAGQLTQFVAMLRRAGYGVQVSRDSVAITGGSEALDAVSVDAPLPVADLQAATDAAASSFSELGFAMRSEVFAVPPEAVAALGIPARAVALDNGGSIVLADEGSLQLVRSLLSDSELSAVHTAGVIPEAYIGVLERLGLSAAASDGNGSVIVGRPADLRDASGVLGALVRPAENVRADIQFVRVERSAAIGVGSILSADAAGNVARALPVLVARSGGRSSLSSTLSLPFSSSVVSDGVVSEKVEYREAGFTASLDAVANADGSVSVDLVLEVSAFGAGDVPSIAAERFEVSALVTSGQTVLLGVLDASQLGGAVGVDPGALQASGRDTALAAVATIRRVGPVGEELFASRSGRVSVSTGKE